ncbi:T9SS type A sorting domain-containing protein [Flavobacterium rakeshii]|uniref:T9SS type A sorting domain-containing protein n=1 Tax=Flavobacterium rakeshii TaxID=1038845 RepID=A0A6N8HAG1_9FLAO|nr:FG-GAP-like repeat-containing protein [Flavobacterium rakeshii]MEE1897181.1 FG-GAP-like repeat-containing protein [Flavobacterium rakeshii]MUV03262.1 T9SS type A sorting domain-containing protein [Flavobacterium rakeshii]
MKRIVTLLLVITGCHSMYAQQSCNNAIAVTEGQYSVTFSNESEIPQNCIDNETGTQGAWYMYTATEDHKVTINTKVPELLFYDTRVMVYTGDCNNLTCIAGDDDSGGYQTSLVTFNTLAGTTYYFAFDNKWSSDDFDFTLTFDYPFLYSSYDIELAGNYKFCVVDINGDYLDDIVSPSNNSVNVLYQSSNDSGFTPATLTAPNTNNIPSWSMAAGDFDKNGYNDLLYGNSVGAAIILANEDGTAFSDIIESPSTFYLFSQRTNFVDINNDGNLDAFVCHDVEPNVYFLNDGEGGHEFIQGGLGDYPEGGNYGSIWIDYDNDGDQDLFIAKCRGGGNPAAMNELHRNDGDMTFTTVASNDTNESNMADMVQTWSSAWADYDNDGDMDVLIGASSFVSGHHKLMLNNGDGTFTDVTAGSGYESFNQLSIEHVAHDFDNDGFVDVFGGGEIIMKNNGDLTFTPVVIPATNGPIGDLNNDGFLDILNGNTVYFNTPNNNNWLKITLRGVESNANGIGARVEIYTEGSEWGSQIRDVRSGDGFRYMSSLNVHFGLGLTQTVDQLVIKWPSGIIDVINNPEINQTTHVTEGEAILNITDAENSLFKLYPNPAKDYIQVEAKNIEIKRALIYTINGRIVSDSQITNNTISIKELAQGTYAVILQDNTGKYHTSKIIKE